MSKKTELLDDTQVAALLRIEVSTLIKNRSIGKNHPPYIKVGKKALYPVDKLEQWLNRHRIIRAAS